MTQEQFFKRYLYDRVRDRLGGGGFGNVYKVFDTVENQHIALKIAEVKPGQESLSLLKEVELASSLERQVNIARYSECYRFDTPTGIFDFGLLQYYPDGNLSQLIRKHELTEAQKEEIAEGLLSGIQHLHRNKIVHRDLKSTNILIAKGYRGEYVPKIADFGLSKQFTENENSYFSNSFAGGSLLYVAPEQLEGKELRKNVDLWSLGVVLYELFTGAPPFRASVDDGSETARAEIISQIRDARIPAALATIPTVWQEIIKRCLVADPKQRIKSVEEILEILGDKTGIEGEITEIDDTITSPPKPPSTGATHTWLYFLIGGMVLATGLIFGIRSCDNGLQAEDDKDFIMTPSGYTMVWHERGSGKKPEVGDYLYFTASYSINDSVLFDSKMRPDTPVIMLTPIDDPETKDDPVFNAYRLMVPGDSITISQRGGQMEVDHFNLGEKTLDFHIALHEVVSEEEFRKRWTLKYDNRLQQNSKIESRNSDITERQQEEFGQWQVEEEQKRQDAAQTPAQKAAEEIAATMVRIPGGTFTMGCTSEQGGDCLSDESPTSQVTLSGFYINKYEVTQGQWEAIMGTSIREQRDKADPSWSLRGVGENYPMYYVSWHEAQDFIRKLNHITGRKYRLPTEAEWEYAARGGQNFKYSGSNNIGSVAWYRENSGSKTHPVGRKVANAYGLYDMSGNIYEWCSDWYGSYSNGAKANPKGPSTGSDRVIRGGGMNSYTRGCRVSYRTGASPLLRGSALGFRLFE